MSLPIEPDDLSVLAEPHMGTRRYIELPAGWCWCADNWLIAGIEDFKEGGKLHSREGCWPRDRATRIHGLPGALDTTFPCCEHCPCRGMDHAVPCPIDGCEGRIGS